MALEIAGTGIDHWDLVVPNLIGGVGMGMIFVPLFDIVLGGVEDHEMGSATGVLGSIQQLAMALGHRSARDDLLRRSSAPTTRPTCSSTPRETTSLVTIGLIALAFAAGFFLPRKPRAQEAHPEPAFA